VFHFDQINAETKVFGVVADPVSHSLSPQIHNAAFAAQGINAVYLPFRVPSEQFEHSLHAMEWLDVRGYSVTLPHKVVALALAQTKIPPTAEIGALNTLFRGPAGEWCGANTDCDAALASLRLSYDPAGDPLQPATDPLLGKRVLILGAGGVARAIATGLLRAGAVVTITNRTKAKAAELAQSLGCVLAGWENRGAVGTDILINCTSVGMHPKVDETPFQQHWLTEEMTVFDTVYTPERTLLIAQARERGCKTVTGVEMFVRQAARQYEYFTGRSAPLEVMRDTLKKAISIVKVT
jgi:3-dehydroquinate dehydratase/shikimate dehydrogenase